MYLHVFAGVLLACGLFAAGIWLTSRVIPHSALGIARWGSRILSGLRALAALALLAATFLLGMWLTRPDFPYNPSGFPLDRKFVAVALNEQRLIGTEAQRLVTMEVRGRLTFRHRVGGTGLCNHWGGSVTFLPARRIRWGEVFITAMACTPLSVNELEERFFKALLRAWRWRTESGTLILDDGTNILRFQLAPL